MRAIRTTMRLNLRNVMAAKRFASPTHGDGKTRTAVFRQKRRSGRGGACERIRRHRARAEAGSERRGKAAEDNAVLEKVAARQGLEP